MVRIWDLEVSSPRPLASTTYQRARRGSPNTADSLGWDQEADGSSVHMCSAYSVDGIGKAIEDITTVSWAANGNTFAVGGRGSVIRQYSKTGEPLQDMKQGRRTDQLGMADIVAVQHYGANSESLFVATNSTKQVRRWDFVRKDYTSVCLTHENDISCLAVCTRKRIVASATAQGGEIAVFNLLHNTRTDLRSATHKALTCIDISPGLRSQIAVGSEDGLLQLFDTSRSGLAPLKAFSHVHTAPVRGIAFHPISSTTILSAGLDGRIAMTDTNAYASGNAPAGVSVASPLTCLATTQDSHVMAVGTIDGGVLVYDVRRSATPLWKSSTGSRRAVTSISLTRRVDSSGDSASQPLRRAASTSASTGRETRGGSYRGIRSGPGGSDERPATSSLAERQFTRSSVIAGASATRDTKSPVTASGGAAPAAAAAKSDGGLRPPHHPSINRFRLAINEHRLSATANSGSAKPLLAPAHTVADRLGTRSPCHTEAGPSSGSRANEDEADNMSILMKDRSYMELISPAKPDQTTSQTNKVEPGPRHSGDILAILSRARSASTMPSPPTTSSRVSFSLPRSPGAEVSISSDSKRGDYSLEQLCSNESSGAATADNLGESPLPRPCRPVRSNAGSRAHDAGDSIMEMFTPERDKRHLPPAQLPKYVSDHVANHPPSGLAHTLAAQLLERQADQPSSESVKQAAGADRTSVAVHRPPLSFATSGSSGRLPELPGQARSQLTQVMVAHDSHSSDSVGTRLKKLAPASREPITDRAAATVAADAAVEMPSSADCLPPAPKRPCRVGDQAATAAIPTALNGLGDIGSSVLQNLFADALAPLREQLRGEIRNLHLDMIRQGFVYQEQVRALRQECGEARELRQELENLRRENELLRRHVPFFSMPSGHANDSAHAG
ncbi:hypothetical protein GGI20_003730 [Coemansia sp. BCRC 34301]|nr:hypothetical protein GGI20_003730 [Coemansia sp. BCRC 34301]